MCKQCEINPVYEFTNKRKICNACFIRWFQKKFLYTIRKFNMIQRGDIIQFKNNKYFRDAVLDDLLKIYSERGIVEIVKITETKGDKIAISSTTDSEADEIIHILIKGDVSKLRQGPVEYIGGNIIIKPLYLFLDKEVLLYAKLKKLKFKRFKDKRDKLSLFIDDLEKKHPEVKQSVIGSYGGLFRG
ncbi:MAG: hypothetical protein WC584_05450 [Candidatus Pacearchaeota archaeon]